MSKKYDTTKTCSRCEQSFPATNEFFGNNKRMDDGLHYYCKPCRAIAGREYREKNREKVLERKCKYYQKNKKQHQEYTKQWRKNNPEQHKEHTRRHRIKYREQRREYNRRWIRGNPDKANRSSHKWRARKRDADGEYTIEELRAQYDRQKGKCYWCDKDLNSDYHADHVIPLSRGGNNYISNIVCSCAFCNISKGNRLVHEWKGTDRLL